VIFPDTTEISPAEPLCYGSSPTILPQDEASPILRPPLPRAYMTQPSSLDTLVRQVNDRALPLARLALVLSQKGQEEKARELCVRAIALEPESEEVRVIASRVLSHKIPQWYFPMVLDTARHVLYERAFARVIRPGCRVLDIGSGTGLFAMMAARAGAAEVITCEANPRIAAAVASVVAHNGLSSRVRVVPKLSSDLEVGVDLPDHADVVVWDNLANGMLAAGALPGLEQAARRLARPGARFVPARGTIRVCLGEDRKPAHRRMGIVEGFDLSPFNLLRAMQYNMGHDPDRWTLRSATADAFHFDFESGGPFPEARNVFNLVSTGGRVNGIVQWLRLDLDDETTYESYPTTPTPAALGPLFHAFDRPRDLAKNEVVTVCGAHDRQTLNFWPEDTGAGARA